MLKVESLVTRHGQVEALHGVSFSVDEREVVAIIGANGAGKSTLLGSIAGLYPPAAGRVEVAGQDLTGRPAEEVVRHGVSLVPERRQVWSDLTVRENLVLGAYPRRPLPAREVAREMEEILQIFPALADKLNRLAGLLSGGEQQMLAIGRSLMARPRLLLIDELSLGLAPLITRQILETLVRLRNLRGTTVVMVEQNARAALTVADRGLVLERGELVLEGPAADLLRDPRIQGAYLGQKQSQQAEIVTG